MAVTLDKSLPSTELRVGSSSSPFLSNKRFLSSLPVSQNERLIVMSPLGIFRPQLFSSRPGVSGAHLAVFLLSVLTSHMFTGHILCPGSCAGTTRAIRCIPSLWGKTQCRQKVSSGMAPAQAPRMWWRAPHSAWVEQAEPRGSFRECQGFPGMFHFIPTTLGGECYYCLILKMRKLRLTEVK